MSAVTVTEVEGMYGDTEETFGYRACDWCYEAWYEALMSGKPTLVYYELQPRGLTCCERCLEEALAELAGEVVA